MKRLFKKWYFSFFIIPIILTYLTSYITLPIIFKNWQYSIITSLIILILILIYELKKSKQFKPKISDKRIIKNLLEELDLDTFYEDLYEQNAWYGYSKEAIRKTISYKNSVKLLKNKLTDKKLEKLLNNFNEKLEDFHSYSSLHLYGEANFYIPNKDNLDINRDKIQKQTEEMNRLMKLCYLDLEKLVNYLKAFNYI